MKKEVKITKKIRQLSRTQQGVSLTKEDRDILNVELMITWRYQNMNEIEKQILKNQMAIMDCLENNYQGIYLGRELSKTQALLNPPEQQSIAERTHDAFSQSNDELQGNHAVGGEE
jgi:hypothetical protein